MTAVIDPGEAEPVIDFLQEMRLNLDCIILTHHHFDHIDGVDELIQRYAPKIVGAKSDSYRLPALDTALSPGDFWKLGSSDVHILEASGHTVGHIAFYFPNEHILFCGDALFCLGCGYLFEGTAAQAWETLSGFAKLPDDTQVFCGHEYALPNAKFVLSIDGDNPEIQTLANDIKTLRRAKKPVITTIGREKRTNLFMRAKDPKLQEIIGMLGASSVDVLHYLLERKRGYVPTISN